MVAHSTRRKAGDKAAVLAAAPRHKAKNKLPLPAHATTRWDEEVNGQLHHFGKAAPALPNYAGGAALAGYHRTIGLLSRS